MNVESPTIVNNVNLTAFDNSTIKNTMNVESPTIVNNVNLTAINASTIENITNSSFVVPPVGSDWKIKASVGLNVIFGFGAFYYINQQIKNINDLNFYQNQAAQAAQALVDFARENHNHKKFISALKGLEEPAAAIFEAVSLYASSSNSPFHIDGMGEGTIARIKESAEYTNYCNSQVMPVGVIISNLIIFPVLNALSSLLTVGVMAMEEAAPIFTFAPILKDLSIGFASYHLYNANKAIDNQYVTALKYSAISHFIIVGMNAPFALIAYDNYNNNHDAELEDNNSLLGVTDSQSE